MKITDLEVARFQSALWSPDKHVRSEGLHLTTIIQAILEEMGESNVRDDLSAADLDDYAAVGFLWERTLTRALNEMHAELGDVVRLGEFQKDGIYFTPDGIMLNVSESKPTLEEWKCTWTSCNKLIDDRKKWMYQIKCYCYALDLDAAVLRVLYINGTWRPPIPCTRHYRLEFSRQELASTWLEVLNFAKAKGML